MRTVLACSTLTCLALSGLCSVACGDTGFEKLDVDLGSGGSSSGGSSPANPSSGGQPSSPSGVTLPAKIEAEDFHRANETSATGEGTESCRNAANPNVEVEALESASGGCAVGFTEAREWLEYDVTVDASADFDLNFAVASSASDALIGLYVDGIRRETLDVPQGDFSEFRQVAVEGLPLSDGNHQIRVVFDNGAVGFDFVDIVHAGPCTASCSERQCGDDLCGGTCGTCDEDLFCSSLGTCIDTFPKAVSVHGQLAVDGNRIVDESGDAVQLRGVSTQWLNWESTYSGQIENMRFMRDRWGLDVYRIANGIENDNGYAVDAVRPRRLQLVKDIIEMAIELDIYVIVDWHTHEIEHLELAKEFFSDIAQTYGQNPHVIYEPFNEPIGGFGGQSVSFWSEQLKPYYEEVIATIREHDPDNLITLGTPLWSQDVDIAAADPMEGENLTYTLHFYSCTHQESLRNKAQKALDLGVALFVTEWGSTHSDGGTTNNPGVCLESADTWHQFLDTNFISSAAWKLSNDGDSSAILLPGAAKTGGWTDDNLSEHGRYVRSLLQRN